MRPVPSPNPAKDVFSVSGAAAGCVVGVWRIEAEGNKKVLAVDGRQWKEGQTSAGIGEGSARNLWRARAHHAGVAQPAPTCARSQRIANGAMRSLRAVYNHARKANTDLPAANPTLAVDWNQEERRNTGMGAVDIVGWLEELRVFENLIRREFHLLLLLSGSRPTALKRARIDHIDFRSRLLHIPRPKGGEDRAFDIPLSRAMIRCIIRTIRIGRMLYPDQATVWLFPADSETGHIEEHKEDRADLSKWGNDLRQSYRTIAQSTRISKLDIHLLMNHAVPGVNEGYITRDKLLSDHLRQQQDRISAAILEQTAKIENNLALRWLNSTKIVLPIAQLHTQAPIKLAA
jgi:integrase